MEIFKITDNTLKREITNTILRDLPDWFEVEEGIVEYVNTQDDKTFYVAKVDDDYAGFFS